MPLVAGVDSSTPSTKLEIRRAGTAAVRERDAARPDREGR